MSVEDIDTEYLVQIRDKFQQGASGGSGARVIRELAGKLVEVICELRELREDDPLVATETYPRTPGELRMNLPQARLEEPAAKAGTTFALDVVLLPEDGGRLYVQVLKLPEPDSMPRVIAELVLTAESTEALRELLVPTSGHEELSDGSPEG